MMDCLKIVLKGNLLEMISNWQISIGYEDNQIMTESLSLSYIVFLSQGAF